MPSKKRNTKTSSGSSSSRLSLTDFTGDRNAGHATNTDLTWAEDTQEDLFHRQTKEIRAQHGLSARTTTSPPSAAGGQQSHLYERKAGVIGCFRDDAPVHLSTVVPADGSPSVLTIAGTVRGR